ncbi:MAG: phosphodiester glycosidase family protein [Candidatus Parcubacteria bacterium]|nr:phosphodiester glycosidase family protein [Candidatus Parcubacteria bacterium]
MTKINFWKKNKDKVIYLALIIILSAASLILGLNHIYKVNPQILALNKSLIQTKKELDTLKQDDQFKINQDLKEKIKNTDETYKKTVTSYEKILDLKAQKEDTEDLDKLFTSIMNYLSELNYSSASADLATLNTGINKKYQSLAAAALPTSGLNTIAQSNVVSNSPPGNGYSFQAVKTDSGTFNVSIIAADLNSTRVIMDTASDSDCSNNCPVMALGDYAGRSGAYAGINGPFFCPAEYPSCAGKTNSFDTLLMNKNKHYFNSDNNKYSTVPLVYFSGNSMGVRGQSLEWGRDTGVDAVVANFPLYVSGGNNNFGGSSDPKINNAGPRTFVANKGNFAYIGIVYNASAAQAAAVLKALGMENALGLDQGGSTALWFGGYKAGPGRGIPSALLFVQK